MRNIGLILVLAVCVYGLWYLHRKDSDPEPVPVADPTPDLVVESEWEPDPEPVPADEPEPDLVVESEWEPEPEPVPVDEPEPVPEKTLDEVVAESIRAQRRIEVPHALSDKGEPWDLRFSEATITRVEPDGLHVRYPNGITKIGHESIPEEWRAMYCMPPSEAAEHYRRVCNRNRREVLRRRAEAARAAEQRRREQQGKRLAQLEREKAKEEAEEDERNRRIAWRNYDAALSRYHSAMERYRTARGRGAVGMRTPRRPVPPPFPRP